METIKKFQSKLLEKEKRKNELYLNYSIQRPWVIYDHKIYEVITKLGCLRANPLANIGDAFSRPQSALIFQGSFQGLKQRINIPWVGDLKFNFKQQPCLARAKCSLQEEWDRILFNRETTISSGKILCTKVHKTHKQKLSRKRSTLRKLA